MGSGMSTYQRPRGATSCRRPPGATSSNGRPRGFVLDPSKGMLPLLGLQVLLEYGRAGSARPPATAALLAANVLTFLRPGALDAILPKRADVALNPNLFFKFRDLKTFFLSPLYHWNEVHLFCNMTNLLWTGVQLETSMGTAEFASMVAALLGLSQGAELLLSKGLCLLGDDALYYDGYVVGFSGVLYGMNVVAMSAPPDDLLHLPGMVVIAAKYAVWAELFLVKALIPNTSFVGHLGGILAGYVYLWLKGSLNRRGPGSFNRLGPGSFNRPRPGSLSRLISCGTRALGFAQKLVSSVLLPKGHVTGWRRAGAGCCASAATARGCPKGCWTCSSCTVWNSLATDVCERCSNMREDYCASSSWGQYHQASCNMELTVEELRLRRVHRFDM